MKELKELVTDLGNINASLVKASTDLDWMADRYDNNEWLKTNCWDLRTTSTRLLTD